jgi:6-pyruvoyl-tetrahydropterin synthase
METSTQPVVPSASVVGQNETVRLFVRELTVLDYAYWDENHGALGGSLDVDVTFVGQLDHEGVVFDFSLAKKAVKRVIDDLCDHRFVVPKTHVEVADDGRLTFKGTYGDRELFYVCPAEGLCVLDETEMSLPSIKRYLEAEVMKVMPENVDAVELILREEALGDAPWYRYTHGLKQHYGNCQRLIHGHRNRVDVFVDGARSSTMEAKVADTFKNIHLAFPENVKTEGWVIGQRQSQLPRIKLSYVSSQGCFELTLPGSDVYVMPLETTVENISRHIRDSVQSWVGSEANCQVFAYEGIRKGSESRSQA